MDTILSRQNSVFSTFAEKAVYLLAVASVVCIQNFIWTNPIMADDLKIAHHTQPAIEEIGLKEKIMLEFSPELRKKKFDENIKEKYPNAIIADVQDGVKHIKLTKYYSGRPVRINIVEVDFKVASNLEVIPVLSNSEKLKTRRTISNIVKDKNAIAAINGTYFTFQSGVPLGTLMIDGKIYTGPVYDRVAMGIFDDGFDVARVQLRASLEGSGTKVKVDNINQPRMLSTHVLIYTPEWGKYSPYAPKYGMGLRVAEGKITKASANPLDIPQNGYVISGPKKLLQPLLKDKDVKLDIKTTPEWKNVKHIISGGPYLVKNGEVFVDMTAQKLGAIGGRNPRTAVGYTSDNNLILLTADGREGSSIGMTLMELANFMKSIGCIGAINLDGGGSTVMYVDGKVVNKPQTRGGIPLSNALVISENYQGLANIEENNSLPSEPLSDDNSQARKPKTGRLFKNDA